MEISCHFYLDSKKWLLQNFVHGTTALLSWHVQKTVAIWWPAAELQPGKFPMEFELRAKKPLVKRALGPDYIDGLVQDYSISIDNAVEI